MVIYSFLGAKLVSRTIESSHQQDVYLVLSLVHGDESNAKVFGLFFSFSLCFSMVRFQSLLKGHVF